MLVSERADKLFYTTSRVDISIVSSMVSCKDQLIF